MKKSLFHEIVSGGIGKKRRSSEVTTEAHRITTVKVVSASSDLLPLKFCSV